MADQHRKYNMSVSVKTAGDQIIRQKNCFAFMFTNIGDTIAFVNEMVIFPNSSPASGLGDSRTINGHILDLYFGNITLAFDAVAPGTNPKVEIVQLYYLEENK